MSDYVPQEVWIEIFTRLPVKTLLRFRSVCKLFHAMISGPSFISHHINSTKHTEIPLVRYLIARKIEEHFELKEHFLLLPSDMDDMRELDFPFKSKSSKHFEIVGSSNGLLCLFDTEMYIQKYSEGYSECEIILWNPSIKKYLSLPKTQVLSNPDRVNSIVLGFGFDCKSDDYKVVRIAFFNERNMGPVIELYSVKSGAWRNFNDGAPLPYWIRNNMSQAFLEGCCHWVGLNDTQNLIVSFDMSNEEFKEVNLPDDLQQVCVMELILTVLGEKLAAVHYHSWEQFTFTVWVMEEYGVVESWRKMYDVHVTDQSLNFAGFTKNGKVLVQLTNRVVHIHDEDVWNQILEDPNVMANLVLDDPNAMSNLVLYDPNDMSTTRVGVHGEEETFRVEMYMESLVLLNEESATLLPEAITCGTGGEHTS